jgi:hypothetical protein
MPLDSLSIRDLTYGLIELEIERKQLIDEGRDLRSLAAELDAMLWWNTQKVEQNDTLSFMDRAADLPLRGDYLFEEPSDLDAVRKARPKTPSLDPTPLSEAAVYDRLYGAWLGRAAGCLLGKPVEGWKTPRIHGYLRDLNRFPLNDYFHFHVEAEIQQRYGLESNRAFVDLVPHMVEDDDMNYTVMGLAILKQYGEDFTPTDVAHFWLENLPILHTWTAERIAYRNLCNLIPPPRSAVVRNPYREMIGAQIRADFWGYIAMGNPERAAEFAWRDACISHTKNGIYGEMWAAAMLAAAPYLSDVREIIRQGLAQIPAQSRLAADVQQVLGWHEEGIDYTTAFRRLHQRWDEYRRYDWLHTNSNAQVVTIGLLWGENDFERSICRGVQCGFDTDCNGATIGSIMGMMQGAQRLPAKWIDPLHDTLATGITGYHEVRLSALASETVAMLRAMKR